MHHTASFGIGCGNKSLFSMLSSTHFDNGKTKRKNLPMNITHDQEFAKLLRSNTTWPSNEEWNIMSHRLFNKYCPEV